MTDTRILFTVTDAITALSFLRGQLAYLRQRGFEVHLACGATSELRKFAASENVVLHDVPLKRSWLALSDLAAFLKAVSVLRSVKPEVLSYSTPKAAAVWALASMFARPRGVVFLLRGLRLDGERPWTLGFGVLWLMELIAARSAHVTVSVSESLRRRAVDLRLVSPSRIVVLGAGSSNGVDTNRFSRISAEERSRARSVLGVDDSTFVIGFIGRLAADKGLLDLLHAVNDLASTDKVACVLVGQREPGLDVGDALHQLPFAKRVTHVRAATRRVEDEYAALDVFVLPSYREGLSNALLEAQSRGLPCITTDGTGCPDAIEVGVTGIMVPRRSPAELAVALRSLMGDSQTRRRTTMGLAGRARVEQHFTAITVWSRYYDLYNRLAQVAQERQSA